MREAEENMYHQKFLKGKSCRNAIISTLLATLYEKSMETEGQNGGELPFHRSQASAFLQRNGRAFAACLPARYRQSRHQSEHPEKAALLTPAETEEMRRHPEIGYRIVQATPELTNVAEFILSHHERWDGAGYPRGLHGKEILLVCRILAVTDAYDAMTNDRSYRSAISREEALLELERNAGTQFDPEIVTAFIETMQSEREANGGRDPV